MRFLANAEPELAVTLAFKQAKQRRDGTYQRINHDVASNNIHHFLNKLNTKAYGNSFKRYGKRIKSVVSLEGGKVCDDKRLHTHFALTYPDYVTSQQDKIAFKHRIVEAWEKTFWGYGHVEFRDIYDGAGWIDYIAKDGTDSINLANTYL